MRTASSLEGWRGKCCGLGALDDALSFSGGRAGFDDALHLHPTVQAVAEYNVAKLHNTGEPIATIKAVHTGPNASKASPEDASGVEPVICLARGARVMLTSNLWTDAGLVNGAMGTVQAICYQSGGPPSLLVAVTVKLINTGVQHCMMEVFQLFPNDVLGYKVVVHVHSYKSPSNLLGQSRYTRLRGLP